SLDVESGPSARRRQLAAQQHAAVSDVLFQHRAAGRVSTAHIGVSMTTTRREFVTIGTIGLLGAKQLLAQSLPETVERAKPILSVGYWDGLMRGDGAEN